MTALKAIFSRLHPVRHEKTLPAGENRRHSDDRRKAERRSNVLPFENREARLRFAAQAAGFGTYDLDCLSGDNHWSPELKAIAGLPQNDAPVSIEQWESLLHPEDRERVLAKYQASLDPSGDGLFGDEHRFLRSDGSVRWVRVRGRTYFIGSGQDRYPLVAAGIVMDITDRRLAEQALLDSRSELDGLLESMIDAVIGIDEEGCIVRFNPAACHIFRCRPEDALGSPLSRFIPERFRGLHELHVRGFSKDGATGRTMGLPGRFSGLRADGEEFPIEASISRVRMNGHVQMTVFLRDISERKAAEDALRRSKEDLELAVRGAAIGVWNWELGSGRLLCSERCFELLGRPAASEMNFERFLEAVHPNDRQIILATVRKIMDEGGEFHVEYRVVWPDGSVHWIEAIGRDLHDEAADKAVGMRGIALDITGRKHQEQMLLEAKQLLESRVQDRTSQLVKANEALERSNLELQQFAFVAAHDLQTPLRSISGFAQLLQKDYQGRLDSQADTWLEHLVRSAHRMRDVVNDILDYSRVESRGGVFRSVDLRSLFDDVVATLETPIRETGAQITRGELPVVLGDRTQLAQVLQNLIDNGLKYQAEGTPPRIHVSARGQADEWVVTVADNGIGIDSKHQDQIFDIFRRLHSQQEYPGTGIGLAICRRVIHRHGGRIWVESEPGRGSKFHFTLPISKGEAP